MSRLQTDSGGGAGSRLGDEGDVALTRGELREKIEIVRAELNAVAEQMGPLAAEVLEKSQELDKLINEYYRMQGE